MRCFLGMKVDENVSFMEESSETETIPGMIIWILIVNSISGIGIINSLSFQIA